MSCFTLRGLRCCSGGLAGHSPGSHLDPTHFFLQVTERPSPYIRHQVGECFLRPHLWPACFSPPRGALHGALPHSEGPCGDCPTRGALHGGSASP